MTFEELNLAPAILKAVLEHGYTIPTPIQVQAIPAPIGRGPQLILRDRDDDERERAEHEGERARRVRRKPLPGPRAAGAEVVGLHERVGHRSCIAHGPAL